jgi:hypothetical protein
MDTDKLFQHARARFDHQAARRVLKEKYQAKLIFAHAGGMWRAGPELLTTLHVCTDAEVVLLDLYETPVRVQVNELRDLAYQRWQEQMIGWLIDLETQNTQR